MTPRPTGPTPDEVPESIVQTLRRLIRRARAVIFLRGCCAVVAAAVAALLVAMAVDWQVTFLSAWPRWLLTGWAAAVTAFAAVWFLVRPLAHSFSLRGIARALESRHPEMQERISSAVELMSSRDDAAVRGSEDLIAAVVSEASHDVEAVQPRREVTLRGARPFLIAAAAATVLMGGLLLARPNGTRRLLARAVAPFLNLPNVAADQLSIEPGDTVIKPRERLRVEVEVEGARPDEADLHRVGPGGERTVLEMAPEEPDETEGPVRFSLLCSPAEESFRYRVRAGDALTRYYFVTVSPPPSVAGLEVRYDYPAYTDRPPRTQQEPEEGIEALEGTTVTVTARADKPVAEARLLFDQESAQPVPAEISPGDEGSRCTFRFSLPEGLDTRWHLVLADEHGFTNPVRSRPVRALPDRPPAARIVNPRRETIRAKPTDEVPVVYAAEDDVGLALAEIRVSRDEEDSAARPLPLESEDGGPARSAAGQAVLDLESPALRGAKKIEFTLRARDNLPEAMDGPQTAQTRTYTVLVDRTADSYAEQLRLRLEERIRAGLEKTLEELEAAKKGSEKLRRQLAEAEELVPEAEQTLQTTAQELDAADAAAREVRESVLETPYESMAPKLKRVADEHIARAKDAAGQVKLTEKQQRRVGLAEETDFRVETAIGAVTELLERFNAQAEALRQLHRVQELASRQQELADNRAAMDDAPEQGPMSPEQWQSAQQQTAAELGELLSELPEAAAERAAEDRERLQELAAEARRLKAEQDELKQDTDKLGRIEQIDEKLQELAEEQKKLAEEAGADELTRGEKSTMSNAAGDIGADRLDPAIEKQKRAAGELKGNADRLRREQQTTDLVGETEKIAEKQAALAEKATAADETVKRASRLDQAADQAPKLAKEQEKLAAEAAKLQEEAAGKSKEAPSPAPPAKQAADRLREGRAEKAAQSANEAKSRLAALAERMEKAGVGKLAGRARKLADAQAELAEQAGALPEGLAKHLQNPDRTEKDAKKAADELAQLSGRQEKVREQLHELARGIKNTTNEAQRAFRRHNPDQAMKAAAESMKQKKAEKAAGASEEAAQRAQAVADAMRKLAEKATDVPDRPAKAKQIDKLANRQDDLRRQVDRYKNERQQTKQQLRETQFARLQREQSELSRQAAELAYRVSDTAPQDDTLEMKAARAANRAAQRMQSDDLSGAEQQAGRAAEDLEELSGRLREEARSELLSDEPRPDLEAVEQKLKLEQETAELAQRQQRAREQMAELAEQRVRELMTGRQAAIEQDTERLGESAEGTRQAMEWMLGDEEAGAAAEKAAGHIGRALEAEGTAKQQLAETNARGAAPKQQSAAGELGQAADALEETARRYAEAARQMPLPDAGALGAEAAGDLSAGYESAARAAHNRRTSRAAMAAQRLRGAEGAMATRAQRMGVSRFSARALVMGRSGYRRFSAQPGRAAGSRPPDDAPANLKETGIALTDWARLPSELRNEILNSAGREAPGEYRVLIRRYFREIARRGGESPAAETGKEGEESD